MSIGNIDSRIRNKASHGAWMLIAYIPTVNFLDEDDVRGTIINRMYHHCMEIVVHTLIKPGHYGVRLIDSQGAIRHCYPRVAAHLADYPEQCLVNVAKRWSSPNTIADYDTLDSRAVHPPRDRDWILEQIQELRDIVSPDNIKKWQVEARKLGLNGVHQPYWRNLPGYRPELAACPDIMHGVIKCWKDHVFAWSRELVGPPEYDARLRAIQPVPGYRHFNSGVLHLSQLTCREDRELQRTHVAIVAGSQKVTPKVIQNLRAFQDLAYIIQYRNHSPETLQYAKDAEKAFSETLQEYVRLGVRTGAKGHIIPHFKIPKFYTLRVFTSHIEEMGSSPQFSTEVIESNHRRMAKDPYKLTNRRNFAAQMCRRLDRDERIGIHQQLLDWCAEQDKQDAISSSLAMYSPKFRREAMDWHAEVLREPERVKARIQKARYWLSDRPHIAHIDDAVIAQLYHLYDLPQKLRLHIWRSLTPQDRVLLGEDAPTVAYLDVWRKLRIRTPDVQDDDLVSQAHSIEAVPPSTAFPYGHCHCVLIKWDDQAQAQGIEGEFIFAYRFLRLIYSSRLSHSASSVDLPASIGRNRRQLTQPVLCLRPVVFASSKHRREGHPHVCCIST
jgi:Plavaka transposase